jgi:hypothetical protein
MIQYWRQVWNTRTGGTTDPNFPFGFVQVCLVIKLSLKNICFMIIFSYQQMKDRVLLSVVFHGFDGIKLLMLVMYQIMLFQMYLWQRQWIYVMMMESKWRKSLS